MTYIEKIQEMIATIDKLYDESGWLRDIADLEEKKYWNEHRKIFYDASKPLRELVDNMEKGRGDMNI